MFKELGTITRVGTQIFIFDYVTASQLLFHSNSWPQGIDKFQAFIVNIYKHTLKHIITRWASSLLTQSTEGG